MGEYNGNYLYCIISTGEALNFGAAGMGMRGDEITTIGFEDIACVVSMSVRDRYDMTRENLLTHQKAIEAVMKDHTVLPIRFSTIANSVEDVRSVLMKRSSEFKGLLKDMEGKTELGLKALWKDMDAVFKEIVESNAGIRMLKDRASSGNQSMRHKEIIRLGAMVKEKLEEKREREAQVLVSRMRDISADVRTGKTHGDKMVVNASFLVEKGLVSEFDDRVRELEKTVNGRMDLKYVGPIPPFNFVNLVIEWA